MSGEASIQLRENRDVSLEMDPGDVLSALNFAAFAAVEAEKGRCGLATDLIYLDLVVPREEVQTPLIRLHTR